MKNMQVDSQQINFCAKNLKDIFDQAKQLIGVNNKLQSTVAFATTFLKPVGKANLYVRFGCVPQKF